MISIGGLSDLCCRLGQTAIAYFLVACIYPITLNADSKMDASNDRCVLAAVPQRLDAYVREHGERFTHLPKGRFVDRVVDRHVLHAAYKCIESELLSNYTTNNISFFHNYRSWHRTTEAPFLSPGVDFGYSYVYVGGPQTGIAKYRQAIEEGTRWPALPVGTMVVKESFDVLGSGKVVANGAFVMRKLAPTPSTWQFIELTPGGKVAINEVAASDGQIACLRCHGAVAASQDFMLYLPKIVPLRMRR